MVGCCVKAVYAVEISTQCSVTSNIAIDCYHLAPELMAKPKS